MFAYNLVFICLYLFSGKEMAEQRDSDIATLVELPGFPFGEVLTVPQNFGSIYLGETFSSFVNVQNDSTQTVRDVVLKVQF